MGTSLHGHAAEQGLRPGRGTASRRRAYAQARRHSALVRLLRVLIPVGSVLAVGALAVSALNPLGGETGLTLESVGVSGTQITMQSPHMTGHRGDNRPYEVTATVALQDVRKPNQIELRDMRARLTLDEAGNQARLRSQTGVFDSGRERLELRGNVHVETDDGQQAELASASVDFKSNTVTSREPVKVTLTSGVIEADALDVVEGGKVITFTGRVRSVFASPNQPAGPEAQAPAPSQPAAARPAPIQAAPAQPAPGRATSPAPGRAEPPARPASPARTVPAGPSPSRTAAPPQPAPTRQAQTAIRQP